MNYYSSNQCWILEPHADDFQLRNLQRFVVVLVGEKPMYFKVFIRQLEKASLSTQLDIAVCFDFLT